MALAGLLGSLIALSKGCYQSSLLLGALIVTPSVVLRGTPFCSLPDDFDVDSLYRAERTALAEFIVPLPRWEGMFYRGKAW